MTTHLADDYPAIKERMEEIAKERVQAGASDNVLPETAKAQHQTYMGWDIYAPVTFNLPDLRGRVKLSV